MYNYFFFSSLYFFSHFSSSCIITHNFHANVEICTLFECCILSLDKKYGSVFWSFLRPEWRGVWRTAASSDGFKESEGAGMPGWNLCFIFVIIYCHAADAMWWNLIKCSNKLRCEILSEIVSGASGRAITASPSPPRLPCFASHSI